MHAANVVLLKIMENTIHSTAALEKPPEKQQAKPSLSWGERVFNWLVYGLWNHGVNLLLSTIIAFNFGGSKAHRNVLSWLKTKGMQQNTAEMVTGITVLSSGGHLTALAVKPLEDRKEEYVRALNTRYSPQEVDQPLFDDRKQTWVSVIGARAFTLGLAVVSLLGLESLVGKNATGVPRIDVFQERVGTWFAKAIKPAADVSGTARFKLGKILALEVIIVTLMSTLFYFSSKTLSKKPPELSAQKPKTFTPEAKREPEHQEAKEGRLSFAEKLRGQEPVEAVTLSRG